VLVWIGEPLIRHQAGGWRLPAGLLVVLLSFGAAFAFLPVNRFAIRLAHRLGRLVVNTFSIRAIMKP
jgi:hypothetical protein